MAPPSLKPRLTNLTPEAVAAEVALAALEHASKLVYSLLSPAARLQMSHPRRSAEELCRETQIYTTVHNLAAYAIAGLSLDAPVQDYFVSLLPLWSSAAGEHTDVDGLRDDADPDTLLGLVICAAVAREQLTAGHRISAVQLAALAGLSATQVRLLARNGEIEVAGGEIDAKAARRWLAARAVPGFARKGAK